MNILKKINIFHVFMILLLIGLTIRHTDVYGGTFNVTRFDDPSVGSGCIPGNCSLRQAVLASRDNPGSTIILPQGVYTLTIPGADNANTNERIGDLDLRVKTTIIGAGIDKTIIQSGSSAYSGIHRIFDNHSKDHVIIRDMTIRNGNNVDGGSGGCVRNSGVLTLESIKVDGCQSLVSGGGISSFHTLYLRNSVISNNIVHNPDGKIATGGGILGGPGNELSTGATVEISGCEIRNNKVTSAGGAHLTAFGGGVSNNATMYITSSVIADNYALNVGGIINARTGGTMSIKGCSVSNNKAKFDVGGIDNEKHMTLVNSTIDNNTAGFGCIGTECERAYAGGIINADGGTLDVINCTISGNSSVPGGGGVLNANGEVSISSSTIVNNSGNVGAGIAGTSPIFIKNSIVAKNHASFENGGNLSGQIVSQGYNLLHDPYKYPKYIPEISYVSGDLTTNIYDQDPMLGDLQLVGGITATHGLDDSSPAYDKGNPFGCTDKLGNPIQTDQRGMLRIFNGRCDIGSYESQPVQTDKNLTPGMFSDAILIPTITLLLSDDE